MNLSELKPTSYELLRFVVRGETLCDIRLDSGHWDGVQRWYIIDNIANCCLSLQREWVWKRSRLVRFESAEEALALWSRGVEPPSITEARNQPDWPLDFTEEVRVALAQIKAACSGDAPFAGKEGE